MGAQGQGQGQGRAELLDGLLSEVRRQAARGVEPNVRRILHWLHEQTGAHVALVAHDAETVECATAGFPRRVLRTLASLLTRLCEGQLAAAATQAEGLHVRCEALGPHTPRPVLVVAGAAEPTAETLTLTSHTSSVLTLLRRAGDSDRTRRDYQHKARQLRFAVLQALLAGEPLLARRMTAGAVPPLLDVGRLRLHLLHCSSADRDGIVRAHQDPSGYHGADLMVQCPVFKEHVICLIADDEPGGKTSGETSGKGGDKSSDGETGHSGGQAGGLSETLRRLVRDNPRYALGISGTHPLDATAAAYSQAAHALAAARTIPDRVAFSHGQSPLVGVLPRRSAVDWAHALLHPLDTAPKTSADITRLAMNMPRSAVAGLLGLSRNTVTAHVQRAERALGCDLADVRSRAAVHLAFALSSSCTDPDLETDDRGPSATLHDLLCTERAIAWARTLLRPLEVRHQRTLQAWIDVNADAQRASHHLGISRNTVRAHLRAAEAALGLDLLTLGTGIHDVVHALDITATRAAESIVHN
ncbi:helix-turn-helix domain-containing protein [Streptomyces sp. CA-132043]|uniref:helix-turn-helix domain-containing protein n=1 Tax=Streptomyces sp. CA-132043 TaxID=3240048 RepID=UPI003D92A958